MKRILVIVFIAILLLSGCRNSMSKIASSSELTEQTHSEQTFASSTKSKFEAETVENNSQTTDNSESKESTPKESSADTESKATAPKTESVKVPDPAPQVPNQIEQSMPAVTEQKASAKDTHVIADKIIEYINNLRTEQGDSPAKKLIGLTEYAKLRSRQLVTNFAHDTFDGRAAAGALKYGKYIDPTLYGMTGEPYYAADTREAIANGGYIGTVDQVAESFAKLAKSSPGHWSYVGGSKYPYIAVGVTYEDGMWYCDIAMSQTNEYEK